MLRCNAEKEKKPTYRFILTAKILDTKPRSYRELRRLVFHTRRQRGEEPAWSPAFVCSGVFNWVGGYAYGSCDERVIERLKGRDMHANTYTRRRAVPPLTCPHQRQEAGAEEHLRYCHPANGRLVHPEAERLYARACIGVGRFEVHVSSMRHPSAFHYSQRASEARTHAYAPRSCKWHSL